KAVRQSAIWGEQEPAGAAAWEAREEALYTELRKGNVPNFLRRFVPVTIKGRGGDGQSHEITYRVMPDYLAIGSDTDYVTIPLGARPAERVADTFGCVLPTAKMVWDIYQHPDTVRLPVRPRSYSGSPEPKERAKQTSTWAYVEYSQALQ